MFQWRESELSPLSYLKHLPTKAVMKRFMERGSKYIGPS